MRAVLNVFTTFCCCSKSRVGKNAMRVVKELSKESGDSNKAVGDAGAMLRGLNRRGVWNADRALIWRIATKRKTEGDLDFQKTYSNEVMMMRSGCPTIKINDQRSMINDKRATSVGRQSAIKTSIQRSTIDDRRYQAAWGRSVHV